MQNLSPFTKISQDIQLQSPQGSRKNPGFRTTCMVRMEKILGSETDRIMFLCTYKYDTMKATILYN